MAFVFWLIFLITWSTSIFQFDKFESTRIGFNPSFTTQSAVEIIENEGIIISDPFFKFKDFNAISRDAVPFEVLIPNLLVLYFANFFSNSLTNGPSDEIHPVFKHWFIYLDSSPNILGVLTGINLIFDFNFFFH